MGFLGVRKIVASMGDGTVFFASHPEWNVITAFLEAVMYNTRDAWAFVSRLYSPTLNLDELQKLLAGSVCVSLSRAAYVDIGKNKLTRSVYVETARLNQRRLLCVHMVKDHGKWKIYSVEQDECKTMNLNVK